MKMRSAKQFEKKKKNIPTHVQFIEFLCKNYWPMDLDLCFFGGFPVVRTGFGVSQCHTSEEHTTTNSSAIVAVGPATVWVHGGAALWMDSAWVVDRNSVTPNMWNIWARGIIYNYTHIINIIDMSFVKLHYCGYKKLTYLVESDHNSKKHSKSSNIRRIETTLPIPGESFAFTFAPWDNITRSHGDPVTRVRAVLWL